MNKEVKAEMEFPVVTGKHSTKPACDGAICAIIMTMVQLLILYEYKPKVDPSSDKVNHHDLMEAAFYCLHQADCMSNSDEEMDYMKYERCRFLTFGD